MARARGERPGPDWRGFFRLGASRRGRLGEAYRAERAPGPGRAGLERVTPPRGRLGEAYRAGRAPDPWWAGLGRGGPPRGRPGEAYRAGGGGARPRRGRAAPARLPGIILRSG